MTDTGVELRNCAILIIDDSDREREQIKEILAADGIFSRYYEGRDGMEGFRLLLEYRPDIVLCDMVMPRYDGLTFLNMRQAKGGVALLTPVLMLTAMDNLQLKVRVFEMGAQDYIIKPIEPLELRARVRVHLKVKKLQEFLIRQNERLEQQNRLLQELSSTDSLTGLFNRRYILEQYETEFANAVRYNYPLSVCMFDLDHFKHVNDTYGHQAGDHVLCTFAEILRNNLRKGDIAGRYGGEEFLVVLPHTYSAGAVVLAERVRMLVQQRPFVYQDHAIAVTVSAGIATFPETPVTSSWDLIRYADYALYEAKRRGRNRVILYDASISATG